MSTTIAVVAAGAMGAAVGARLAGRGARVLTSTAGRSAASVGRARAADMISVSDDELVAADFFLSIVPPNQAAGLAQRVAERCKATGKKLVYIDLNAVSPQTAAEVAKIIAPSGAVFVDGGIIGGPPKGDAPGPTFYISGPVGNCVEILGRYGIVTKALDGGIGAASALKMSYAGITKGMTALGASMILAAKQAGVDDALYAELGASQAQVLARLKGSIPDMLPKAYRWVPEMREIAGFIGAERPESGIYEGMAKLYAQIAADLDGEKSLASSLTGFFARSG
jgi:3-hydroxyisobutyrate dehydrogenase-like beta-hydroxyacid dehydrogenase